MRARYAFAGTPDFSATVLARLLRLGHAPQLVLTGPARPRGRGRIPRLSPVAELAREAGLATKTPETRAETTPAIAGESLDTVIVAAYGFILPPSFLNTPRYGCLNVHASLLPRWRGAAPIERALMAGDSETGVSIMQIDDGLDTGPLLACAAHPIGPRSHGAELHHLLAELGADLVGELLPRLAELQACPQTGTASYAAKLTAADAQADWSGSAFDLDRRIRALAHRLPVRSRLADVQVQLLAAHPLSYSAPVPGEILEAGPGGIIVACGQGALKVAEVRLNQGKGSRLSAAAAINGFRRLFHAGARFQEITP